MRQSQIREIQLSHRAGLRLLVNIKISKAYIKACRFPIKKNKKQWIPPISGDLNLCQFLLEGETPKHNTIPIVCRFSNQFPIFIPILLHIFIQFPLGFISIPHSQQSTQIHHEITLPTTCSTKWLTELALHQIHSDYSLGNH